MKLKQLGGWGLFNKLILLLILIKLSEWYSNNNNYNNYNIWSDKH